MDIDTFGDKVESVIERVKKLNYKFRDESLKADADKAKEEAVELLEQYLELATEDNENSPDPDENEGD